MFFYRYFLLVPEANLSNVLALEVKKKTRNVFNAIVFLNFFLREFFLAEVFTFSNLLFNFLLNSMKNNWALIAKSYSL